MCVNVRCGSARVGGSTLPPMRTAGRAFIVYVAVILLGIAIGFLYQTVGIAAVIAFVALLIASRALLLRRRRRPTT